MSSIDTEKLFHEYWSKASLNIGPYGIGGSDVQEGFEAGFEAAVKQRDEAAKRAIDAVTVMEKCLRSLQLSVPILMLFSSMTTGILGMRLSMNGLSMFWKRLGGGSRKALLSQLRRLCLERLRMQIKIKPVSFTAWKFAWFCASSGSPKKFPFCSWQFGIQIYRSNCAREYVVCFGRWRFGPTWCRTEIDTIKPNMALVRGDDGYWRPAKKTDRVMGIALSSTDADGCVLVDLYGRPERQSKV